MTAPAPAAAPRRPRKPRSIAQRIGDSLTIRLAIALATLAPRLSIESAQRLGRFGARVAYVFSPARRERTLAHIRKGLPSLDDAAHQRILRETYDAMGSVALESMWAPCWRHERDAQRLAVPNIEVFDRLVETARRERRGILFISAHLGCWELLKAWLAVECSTRLGQPLLAVAAEPKNPALLEPMKRIRELPGMKMLWRGEAARPMARHLRAGGAAVILGDHNIKGEGIEVDFLGHPAHTLLAPARLIVLSNAIAATLFCYRQGPGRAYGQFDEALDTAARPGEPALERESRIVRAYSARIERAILHDPGQWLWMHRRWEPRRGTIRPVSHPAERPPEDGEHAP